ncbi:MAG: hypothetical protein JXE07_07240 [Candidatus Aminicenantes bacterium]|nr:hypothetical protein [Candidatus Aminicenantes bacterium]
MIKKLDWRIWLAFILVAASAGSYIVHYLIFRDAHHIFIYMIGDIAFLFISVLVVTLFIERVLAQREKRALINKLNMVIGIFFSEIGLKLMQQFNAFVSKSGDLRYRLEIKPGWTGKDFLAAAEAARRFPYEIRVDLPALVELQTYLSEKRDFLVRLLENPNLLEHERFTNLLWAVFHLAEELSFRGDRIEHLPDADYAHLGGDLKRAYSQIAGEWMLYTWHLKRSYPFLFSLAARVNPFLPNPTAIID